MNHIVKSRQITTVFPNDGLQQLHSADDNAVTLRDVAMKARSR